VWHKIGAASLYGSYVLNIFSYDEIFILTGEQIACNCAVVCSVLCLCKIV
jgi:hypothetical protein